MHTSSRMTITKWVARVSSVIVVGAICMISWSLAHAQTQKDWKQQWFSTFSVQWNAVTFTCEQQCILVMDQLTQYDYLNIIGKVTGHGTIWFWFLVGTQFVPGVLRNFQDTYTFPGKYFFSDTQQFPSIPKTANVTFIVQGSGATQDLTFVLGSAGPLEWAGRARTSFRRNEPMTPYSINLRKWVIIGGKSIVHYAYILCLVLWLYIFIKRWNNARSKDIIAKQLFIACFGIFLLVWMRNLATVVSITAWGVKNLYPETRETATYFELGDYIVFTEKVREELKLDEIIQENRACKIYAEWLSNRPYIVHRRSVYLKPCSLVENRDQADYVLYYKKQPVEPITNENLILSFQGSYLLKRK